jgi:hypothetical protein
VRSPPLFEHFIQPLRCTHNVGKSGSVHPLTTGVWNQTAEQLGGEAALECADSVGAFPCVCKSGDAVSALQSVCFAARAHNSPTERSKYFPDYASSVQHPANSRKKAQKSQNQPANFSAPFAPFGGKILFSCWRVAGPATEMGGDANIKHPASNIRHSPRTRKKSEFLFSFFYRREQRQRSLGSIGEGPSWCPSFSSVKRSLSHAAWRFRAQPS